MIFIIEIIGCIQYIVINTYISVHFVVMKLVDNKPKYQNWAKFTHVFITDILIQ